MATAKVNFTLPEGTVGKLKALVEGRKRSAFVASAIEEKLRAMEERGSPLMNALAELPDPKHPARRVIQEHKRREYKRVVRLCKAAGFPDPGLSANLFSMMLEGAHSCVQSVGMRQIGEHLVQVVDLMVETNRQRGAH